ncbi:pro-sigmaK processing inhibitor BofA family protein [Terrilactibacillus laevilacticus]|uniref:Pro-sigmaK processing inhibitor BofA family protein n=1 Tax=Terrilactibacillus laevilacticus TaxID=1380157 RepID=A0ABW5PP12_9BACI|nr:pro-sigmaK processing inhibitor BofA family protein [Terrilactibacillus laevilacticus]
MYPILGASIFVGILLVMLFIGAPLKPIRWLGQLAVKLVVGAFMLFILNTVGELINLHVPINAVTTSISGLLGLPGVAALAIIKYYIIT